MSTCVISQPRLFPGLHYLHRMMEADFFVIFDTVQYNPRHEENRAKIKTSNGPQWVTVPMRRNSRDQLIQDTVIDNNQKWQKKFLKTLETNYRKTEFYDQYFSVIEEIILSPHETLTALDVASWQSAISLLNINCQFVYASQLPVSGKGSEYLLNICKHLGVQTYLSGGFGREYLDLEAFAEVGIGVEFHEYSYPNYSQKFGEFEPYLSYLDVLFNAAMTPDLVLSGIAKKSHTS